MENDNSQNQSQTTPLKKIRFCRSCPDHVPYTQEHSKACKRKASEALLNESTIKPIYTINEFNYNPPTYIHVKTRTEKEQIKEEIAKRKANSKKDTKK